MYEDIKTLSVSYPIIGTYNDITKNIVDAKIVVTVGEKSITNSGKIQLLITYINNNEAKLVVSVLDYGILHITVPVVILSTGGIPCTNSYILIKEPFSKDTPANSSYILHPDCLVVLIKAPVIYAGFRNGPSSVTSAIVKQPIKLDYNDLKFIDGNNVSFSGAPSSLYIEAGAGFGTGVFDNSPTEDTDNDNQDVTIYKAKGLKSINGISGNVVIGSTVNGVQGLTISVTASYMDDYDVSRYGGENFTTGIDLLIKSEEV